MHSLGKIQQSFHRALQSYNDNASIQQKIAQRLVELAIDAGLPSNINRSLEIGCGTGFLTQQLAQHLSSEKLFINDLVAGCEDYIHSLLPTESQWQFLAGNIEDVTIPGQLEVISSASTLQWIGDLPLLLKQLTQRLNSNGYLVLSSFSENHFIEIRSLQKGLSDAEQNQQVIDYPMNYWSAEQWQLALSDDYDIHTIESETQITQFDSVKELLMHLRLTGVNGNARQRWTQQKLSRFEQAYTEHFHKNGKFQLSYNPIYVIAQKKGNAQ